MFDEDPINFIELKFIKKLWYNIPDPSKQKPTKHTYKTVLTDKTYGFRVNPQLAKAIKVNDVWTLVSGNDKMPQKAVIVKTGHIPPKKARDYKALPKSLKPVKPYQKPHA